MYAYKKYYKNTDILFTFISVIKHNVAFTKQFENSISEYHCVWLAKTIDIHVMCRIYDAMYIVKGLYLTCMF